MQQGACTTPTSTPTTVDRIHRTDIDAVATAHRQKGRAV
jgi:hypothetical protein